MTGKVNRAKNETKVTFYKIELYSYHLLFSTY